MTGFLNGIRVLSFTTGVAGPNAARILAQCGAEVIKIESQHGADGFRFFSAKGNPNASERFIEMNQNVLSAQLNLKHPVGLRLARELAAISDVVLDNFRPDVLPRLGLGVDDLRAVKQDLVIVKMPGLGSEGPKSWYGTWGSTLMAYSGVTHLWNHPGQARPVGSQGVYPDYVASVAAPAAVIAALLRRNRTGQGLYLDVAQAELTAYMLGTAFLDASVNGRDPQPVGNDWPYAAPHNCYPCLGEDRWCVVACETEEEWQQLCAVMGQPGLAHDPRFAPLAQRRRHLPELDAVVAAWTSERDAHEVMHRLQEAGVPCGVVQSGQDLFEDQHLRARDFIATVQHPLLGPVSLAGVPMRISDGGLEPARNAPMLGEHTRYVLGDLLGYDGAQIEAWQEEGALQ